MVPSNILTPFSNDFKKSFSEKKGSMPIIHHPAESVNRFGNLFGEKSNFFCKKKQSHCFFEDVIMKEKSFDQGETAMERIKFTLAAFADEAAPEPEGQIRAMKRNGLSHIEIRGVGKINCGNLTGEQAKELRKRLDAEGLKIRTVGSPFGKFPAERDFSAEGERFLRAAETARILGADKMRIFSFYRSDSLEESAGREIALTRLRWMAEETKDLLLCHENEKGIYGDGWEFCKIICREIPQIRAIFDPANFVQCGVDTLKAWEELKDFTEYLHLKDSRASGIVVPCGEGDGNVAFILGDFIRRGGRFATMEPHLSNFASRKYLEREEYKTCGYAYKDNDEAFDAAVVALRKIFDENNVTIG